MWFTVTVVDPFVVSNTLVILFVARRGVMSKNCPSEYMYNFLSVPSASNLTPSKSVHANCPRAAPIKVSVVTSDQPPIFSG